MKILNNSLRQILPRLGSNQLRFENSRENFRIYIRKSQWKIDFLPIFSPIFQDLFHFIQLWKIPPFFYNNFFRFRWGGESSPSPLRAPRPGKIILVFYNKFHLVQRMESIISSFTEWKNTPSCADFSLSSRMR